MLDIVKHGIVQVLSQEHTRIVRPGRNGGAPSYIDVPQKLADDYRFADGDIVTGMVERTMEFEQDDESADVSEPDVQTDEPGVGSKHAFALSFHELSDTFVLTTVDGVNGYSAEEADERPYRRSKRSSSERTRPDRWLKLSTASDDILGSLLDFAAPLGCGDIGAIMGEHGVGLSYTTRGVIKGVVTNAPDCTVIVLMIQSRSEEVTDLRRRFPGIDVVVCPTVSADVSAKTAQLIPTLALETAQRQSEMGKDVVLVIDSLTALWSIFLELEEATAQYEADNSAARRRIREYLAKAGCFHGEAPLGGSPGGSITIVGTVWDQPVDPGAEEDRESHPYLRLVEHISSDLSWRIVLNSKLAMQRQYPAIEFRKCFSRSEEGLLTPDAMEALFTARGSLDMHKIEPIACHQGVCALLGL